jgi:LacI family transcriptional regulator
VVGIVINDLSNPFFAELLVGMQRRLDDAGFVSLMAHTGERLEAQERVLNSMREHNAAGLILCPVFGTSEKLLESIRASGMPLVLTVRPPQSAAFDFVGTDHERGTHTATTHLIERGHRCIAFMGRAGAGLVYDKRRAGYERAMRELELAIESEWLIDTPLGREGGREGIRRILGARPRPTAAVCYNDVVAFGAMSELGEHGLVAGRDLAITGFDGVIAAAHSNPPLTTVDTRPEALGSLAADALLERLADPGRRRSTESASRPWWCANRRGRLV